MRIFLSLLLAAGAVFGIGSGVAHLHHGRRHHRQHMMDRVAETCVEAARRLDERTAADDPGGADWGPDGPPPGGHHDRRSHRGHHGRGPGDVPPYRGAPPPQTVFVPYPVAFPAPPPAPVGGPHAASPPVAAALPAAPAPAQAE